MVNVPCCDFIVYSSFEDKYHITSVNVDLKYCTKLLCNLKSIYFEKLIHEICSLTINESESGYFYLKSVIIIMLFIILPLLINCNLKKGTLFMYKDYL